ncbi:MAG: glutamate 2,3-aminomutase [Dethiobacteria bacterium]|jgi:glutamate 2,3-aminomutase
MTTKKNNDKNGKALIDKRREIANNRAAELKKRIIPYLEARERIKTGFSLAEVYKVCKKRIMEHFGVSEDEWEDWHWQMRNRISDVETLSNFLNLKQQEKEEIESVAKKFRWAVSPYYLSLMDPNDPMCPVRRQGIPDLRELTDTCGNADPMAEEFTSPAPRITRRYPDRLIINVTNQCAMFCRHCQRRRNIGEVDQPSTEAEIREALSYIAENEEIRDVLITGGDPLTLSDKRIDWILSELDAIPHVEIKRIGTRIPVTMPQRITPELCKMLEKHYPLYINTHFNNPREVTEDAKKACLMLAKAGIPLGNQAVLLQGINNDPHVMKKLNHELLKIHVRPYYMFHAKSVCGTTHFCTTVQEGIEIMENLRGQTSGLAIPTYIINAPGGNGKTPILPQYLISQNKDYVIIRSWEGKIFKYSNHPYAADDHEYQG